MRLELLYILRNRAPAFRLIANDGLDGGPKVYPDFYDKMAHMQTAMLRLPVVSFLSLLILIDIFERNCSPANSLIL